MAVRTGVDEAKEPPYSGIGYTIRLSVGKKTWTKALVSPFVLILLFPLRMEYEWWRFGSVSVLDPLLLLLLVGVGIKGLLSGHLDVGNRRVFALMALPLVFAAISIGWSINVGATAKSIVVYGAALATFVVTIQLFRSISARAIAQLMLLLPLVLIATAVLSYVPYSIVSPQDLLLPSKISRESYVVSYMARFSHPFLGLSNSFATILAMLLPLVLVMRKLNLFGRLPDMVAMLTLGGILATGSRGVILAVIVAFGILVLWRMIGRKSVQSSGVILVIASILIASIFVVFNPVAQEHLAGRLDYGNIEARLSAFSSVFSVLDTYPLGVGSGVALGAVAEWPGRSVHNAYLQNLFWFGWGGGTLLTLMMFCLPLAIFSMRTQTLSGTYVKQALLISVMILLLVNMSQASWEGSEVRVWIYFIIGFGVMMIRKFDREVLRT